MTTIVDHFNLGQPQVAGPLAVFPVFGRPPRLEYRSFAQAVDRGAVVKEVDGGAVVGSLVIENPTELALLVYEGEEVLGGQQNRSFDSSVLVGAGGRTRAPVSCVEEHRWDSARHGEAMRPSPQAADPSLRRLKRRTANLNAEAGAAAVADQHEVWHAVGARLNEHGVCSQSAAMSDLYDRRRAAIAEIGGAVRHVDGQLGAVASVAGEPVALDLVSRPHVFASLLPRLAQGYALDALEADEAETDPEAAAAFLDEALGRAPHGGGERPGWVPALRSGRRRS